NKDRIIHAPVANETNVTLSGIRVFEYEVTDFSSVFLIGDDKDPLWPDSDTLVPTLDLPGVAVLHIYNEPRRTLPSVEEQMQHNLAEINQSLTFLGVPLTFTKDARRKILPLDKTALPGLLQ